MFSVRFRRVRRSVRRRNNFFLSRQNLLSLTLDISHKEYIILGNVLDDLLVTLTQGHGCGIN